MAIFIKNPKKKDCLIAEKDAIDLFSKPDDLVRQIVRTWHQSKIKHSFDNQKSFKKAVRRNRETLGSAETIETLFMSSNYRFSTKAKERKETLYFEDCTAKRTGRLRQQHPKGPLAKIDKKAKTHRFLSKKRFEFLKKWRKEHHKDCLPCFYICEEQVKIGSRHIEFAYDAKEISGWHRSGGRVKIRKQHLNRYIVFALKEILGGP